MQLQTPGIVEIVEDGYHLSIYRGFLTLTRDKQKIADIPLDDIHALILTSRQLTLSRQVLVQMAERGTPTVISGEDYMPVALVTPTEGHFYTAAIMKAQISASSPLKKRLWQDIIKRKIAHQSAVLRMCGKQDDADVLAKMQTQVKSGDMTYMESTAARFYWPKLFGAGFIRNRTGADANGALNYGYAVLRASVARAVCGAGLLPALGIHHRNQYNAFQLVDDLMEPWRPVVDWKVYNMLPQLEAVAFALMPDIKQALVSALQFDLVLHAQTTPLYMAIAKQAKSLADSFMEKRNLLALAEWNLEAEA